MRMLSKIRPTSNLHERLFCNSRNRCYNSLLQELPSKFRGQNFSSRSYGRRIICKKFNSGNNVCPFKKQETSFLATHLQNLSSPSTEFRQPQGNKRRQAEQTNDLQLYSKYQTINNNLDLLEEALYKIALGLKSQQPLDFEESKAVFKIFVPHLRSKQNLWNERNTAFVASNRFLTNMSPLFLPEKSLSTSSLALIGSNTAGRNPNYEYPFLTKLFGIENLLMSSDAYNQALIEAAKRRAALEKCKAAESEKLRNAIQNRPKVTHIKMCIAPKQSTKHVSNNPVETDKPCPTSPVKFKAEGDGGCSKKDDPCKPSQCPDPCKEELEKVRKNEEIANRKNKNKMPTGCESPKCKRDDCNKPPKSPCKAATNQQLSNEVQHPSETSAEIKKLNKDQTSTTYGKKCSSHQFDGKPKNSKQNNPNSDKLKKECKPNWNVDPSKSDKLSLADCKKPPSESNKTNKDSSENKNWVDPCKKEKEERDPCKRRGETIRHKNDPCRKGIKDPCHDRKTRFSCKKDGGTKYKDQKQKNQCSDEHKKEYKPKCNPDPCKGSSGDSKKPSNESGKTQTDSYEKKNSRSPCKSDKLKAEQIKQKNDSCKRQQKDDSCKKEKKDPCSKTKKKETRKTQKQDVCKKEKDDCGKKEDKDPCKKPKEDPCKKKKSEQNEKKNPCDIKKEKDDPCKKDQKNDDPCKKKCENSCKNEKQGEEQKEDPCKKQVGLQEPRKMEDPCKKQKQISCCKAKKEKQQCSGGIKRSPCKSSSDLKSMSRNPSSTSCIKKLRKTKPRCGRNKKHFSTLAAATTKIPQNKRTDTMSSSTITANDSSSSTSLITRSLITLPSLRNKNFYSSGLMRHFSSKGKDGKNDDSLEDFGKGSQCKTVGTRVPTHRKPVFNPHPKDGLRQCYPTYDMDCKKLCKDSRKTACKKYAFLKDTDNNDRKNKK